MFDLSLRRASLVLILSAAVGISGCGKKADDAAAVSALSDADSILRYIPADTPYVVANPGPIDESLFRKMSGELNMVSSLYDDILDDVIAGGAAELPENSEERAEMLAFSETLKSFVRLLTLDGMQDAGFDINEAGAFYGNGLLPVLRMKLIDEERYASALAEIERNAEVDFETGEVEGQPYRYIANEGLRFIAGVFDDYVVLTMAPDSFGEAELAELVGLTRPAESLASSGKLSAIASDYGYTRHFIGFADTRRIASTFLDQPAGLNAALFSDDLDEFASLSDACRAEFRELADVVPRIVFGYSKIAEDGVDGSAVVELRNDIAEGMQTLTAPVPGLGKDFGALLSFGIGIDPMAFREFYSARLDAIEADPYECEELQELNASVEQGRAMLAQPVPPIAYDFRGLVAVMNNIDFDALDSGVPPMDAEATVLVAVENAPALLAMGAAFSPELAGLDIQADGTPVALEVPQAAMLPEMPYAAMTDSLLAVATGADAERRIAEVLESDTSPPATFMSVTGDAAEYYRLVGRSMTQDVDDEGLSPETLATIAEAMDELAKIYDRMALDVRFTERGVEVESRVTFKE